MGSANFHGIWSSEAAKLIASRRSPQDLTAVAWAGLRLVIGDADGRLTALALPANLP
jgi:hypothetical protein